MDGRNEELARGSPLTAYSHGAGIGTSATQQSSKAQPAYVQPYLSVHEPIRKQRGFHGSTRLDLKLRHTRVSFVKIGHDTSEEGTISTEEAGTIILGPLNKPSVAQTPIHGSSVGRLGLQNSSSLSIPTSSNHNQTENDFTPLAKQNENVIHHEVMKPQGTILAGFSTLPPYADPLLKRGGRRRSSSPLSNSSEEIIIFSGRKRATAKTPNATNWSTSFVESSEKLSGFMGLRKPNSLVVLSTAYERTCNPSRSTSPEGASLGAASFTKELADVTKGGRLIPDESNPIGLARSRNTRKYEILANYVADTDKIDEDDSSAIGQFSDASEGNSTDSGECKTSSKKHMAHFTGSPRNGKKHDLDYRDLLKNDISARRKAISTQEAKQQGHQKRFYEHAEMNQDLISEGQLKLEAQANFDYINTEQNMRMLRIENMARKPIPGMYAKIFDLDPEFTPLATDDEDEYQEKDEASLPNMSLLQSQVLPKAGKIKKSKKVRSSAATFPDESDVFDYGEFDILDRQRPSIQPRGKTKNRHINLEPCDLVFENSMQIAWEGDREKKKLRKQAREDLRQLGLLDKKGKASLKSRYSQGLSLGDVEEQLKGFLQSPQESLALPPMGHKGRKMVHEIANNLGLKSKSIGKGNNRFPVLYKSTQTGGFDASALDTIISRIGSGRHIPRRDKCRGSGSNMSRRRFGGGFSHAAVSYHDGEIVGAAAPELGQDNKGRAMLEKMGWSTGTALGASNNKGIMKPVAHVVKTTKAGLG